MDDRLGIVDLALHAASICSYCRQGTRPADETDQEHGDLFFHRESPQRAERCRAEQIWALIRRLEAKGGK